MRIEDLALGDTVCAATTLTDDGSIPSGSAGKLLAKAGARGVITMIGYVEAQPERSVLLVRFEDDAMNLGAPIGCWVEELLVELS